MSANRFIEIAPTNVPSNGKISFRNGHPVIQFIIGASDHLLLGNTIRLCGDFQCFQAQTADGIGTPIDNTILANMDAKTGIFSTMDQLVIKNHGQFSTIEQIKSYNRFMASYLPVTSSLNDTMGHFSNTALTCPNFALMKSSIVDNVGTVSPFAPQNSFSVHLPSGFLLGNQPIFLGQQGGINGLVLEIHLAPDSNVFHVDKASPSAADVAAISNCYYEFSNLKLTAELVEPDSQTLSQFTSGPGQTYNYNSISSYYTSINSANAVVNFNLGLRNVLGVFANFVSAARLNNFQWNGLETRWIHNAGTGAGSGDAAFIKTLIWTKGGTKYPLSYDTETLQKDAQGNDTVDPSVIRDFMDSIVQFSKPSRTSVSPDNTYQTGATPTTDNHWVNNGQLAGIGMAYDQISDQGVDFSTQNFGIQMSCNLISDNPTGLYLFVHHKATLVFNASGLQVLK
tara:strand:+ start:35 stop:1396 length:1362 start_codon:yes stop_codon:yes gene_type:complete